MRVALCTHNNQLLEFAYAFQWKINTLCLCPVEAKWICRSNFINCVFKIHKLIHPNELAKYWSNADGCIQSASEQFHEFLHLHFEMHRNALHFLDGGDADDIIACYLHTDFHWNGFSLHFCGRRYFKFTKVCNTEINELASFITYKRLLLFISRFACKHFTTTNTGFKNVFLFMNCINRFNSMQNFLSDETKLLPLNRRIDLVYFALLVDDYY